MQSSLLDVKTTKLFENIRLRLFFHETILIFQVVANDSRFPNVQDGLYTGRKVKVTFFPK